MRPANGRRRYNGTSSLIGWAHTQNNPCNTHIIYLSPMTSEIPRQSRQHTIYSKCIDMIKFWNLTQQPLDLCQFVSRKSALLEVNDIKIAARKKHGFFQQDISMRSLSNSLGLITDLSGRAFGYLAKNNQIMLFSHLQAIYELSLIRRIAGIWRGWFSAWEHLQSGLPEEGVSRQGPLTQT